MLRAAPFASLLCLSRSFAFWFDQRPSAWPGWSLTSRRRSPHSSTIAGARSRSRCDPDEREPAPEIVAQFRREAEKGKEDEGEHRAYLDPELAEPLNLAGRSLRRADLSGSKLWKGGSCGRSSRGRTSPRRSSRAPTSRGAAPGRESHKAQLQGADLLGASSRARTLGLPSSRARTSGPAAQLQGAFLRRAPLQGAFLLGPGSKPRISGAELQAATLARARAPGREPQWGEATGCEPPEPSSRPRPSAGSRPRISDAQLQGAHMRRGHICGENKPGDRSLANQFARH